ncbi:BnaA06g38620D [Brassica napus]|uniref:H(+)-exporting diphosphatase n=1 Tax=Brassica napus TaxID=3708 RepID=A0A078JB54_BRANA|nr:BnaA06g38620D [Brassica napus]
MAGPSLPPDVPNLLMAAPSSSTVVLSSSPVALNLLMAASSLPLDVPSSSSLWLGMIFANSSASATGTTLSLEMSNGLHWAYLGVLWRETHRRSWREDGKNGNEDYLIEEEEGVNDESVVAKCAEIQTAISEGATSFLFTEYKYVGVFMVLFAAIIFLFLGSVQGFSTKSQPCTYDKTRTCKPALATAVFSTISFVLSPLWLSRDEDRHLRQRQNHSGSEERRWLFTTVMTGKVSLSPSLVMGLVDLPWRSLVELVVGSTLDVGADLVGKVERNIPEDDPRNPAVIADNVGDNVGDIAGMGSDLFGSYAESSCAALVVASISSFGINHVVPIAHQFSGNLAHYFDGYHDCWNSSSVVDWVTIFNFGTQKVVKNWELFLCVAVGLWAGLIIGFVTEYYTSNAYSPVQDVADSCRTGAATNVIFGLALGYKSVIIPIFAIAVSIFVSFSFAAMYGVAVAALGMLSTIATGLAIDAYGPISDNAGSIAEMAGMSHRIRERTDALDAAIGKDFAIGSAALVSLALFASNTGGAWDNAKKYIEPGASEHARSLGPKGSEPHKAAVIGDTIGDPLKDTSGPSLNILIKLMAVESLVFAPFFATHGGFLFRIFS